QYDLSHLDTLLYGGSPIPVPVLQDAKRKLPKVRFRQTFASTETGTAGTVLEWIIPLTFMALLLPALPLFAYAEERMFRTGAQRWARGRRTLKVLQFGMIHAIIGIPIGAAMALSIGGAYFMWVYLRAFRVHQSEHAATIESTTAHTVYNGLLVILVLLAITLDAVL
ncbi:MAG: hypothetical protein ABMA25_28810, partial [Ilumatobacteraceae bacterium]